MFTNVCLNITQLITGGRLPVAVFWEGNLQRNIKIVNVHPALPESYTVNHLSHRRSLQNVQI